MSAIKNGTRTGLTFGLTLVAAICMAGELRAETHKDMTGVVSKIVIKATPEEVFSAIKTYRKSEPLKRKIIEEAKGRSTIKETFAQVPVLGDVDCTYQEIEEPYTRIDFQMISSNKLKVFEGNWQLTPINDGKSTLVKLTSFVDSDANMPAKDFLQHLSTHQDIHKRLTFVKKLAESEDQQRTKTTSGS